MTGPAAALFALLCGPSWAVDHVEVGEHRGGPVLLVDGEPFFVRGMNWGYMPIGQNYSYDFWGQPDAFIEGALRFEGRPQGTEVPALIPLRWCGYTPP